MVKLDRGNESTEVPVVELRKRFARDDGATSQDGPLGLCLLLLIPRLLLVDKPCVTEGVDSPLCARCLPSVVVDTLSLSLCSPLGI